MEMEYTFLGMPAQVARLARRVAKRLWKKENIGPPLDGVFYVEHWKRIQANPNSDYVVVHLAGEQDGQYEYLGKVEAESIPGGKSLLIVTIDRDEDWPKVEPHWIRLRKEMERQGQLVSGQAAPQESPPGADAESVQLRRKRRGGPLPTPEGKKRVIVEGWLRVRGTETQEGYCSRVGVAPSTLRGWMRDMKANGELASS